jgi:PTH1 family peptidyl-tRNA hydrolase
VTLLCGTGLYMFLIAGLGNPGREYAASRHNMGFLVVDEISRVTGIALANRKFDGDFGQGAIGSQKVALLKPQTYMNLSGASVAPAAAFYKVAPAELLVVHDELDLPFGRVQVKVGGGSGGHNGLRSIAERLGTQDFSRVRVGIGKPTGLHRDATGHVLSAFSKEEQSHLGEVIERAAAAARCVAEKGVAQAMNAFNRK